MARDGGVFPDCRFSLPDERVAKSDNTHLDCRSTKFPFFNHENMRQFKVSRSGLANLPVVNLPESLICIVPARPGCGCVAGLRAIVVPR
jgi:hypothetical protein